MNTNEHEWRTARRSDPARNIPSLFLALALTLAGCSTSSSDRAETASCCTTNLAPVAAALPDQSLYQLDSTWTNDAGRAVKLDTLRDRIQIVAMFFASCTYACPIIVHDMQRIEATLPAGVREQAHFTLITIDTERDTVEALHAFREARKLPADRWTLLRGSPDDTLELAALLGVKFKREASGQFAHSNLITVLNEQGEIVHRLVGLNQDTSQIAKRIAQTAAK